MSAVCSAASGSNGRSISRFLSSIFGLQADRFREMAGNEVVGLQLAQGWYFLAAAVAGEGTAGVKDATRRRGQRRRYLPGNRRCVGVGRCGGDQGQAIGMPRVGEDRLFRSDLDEAAEIEHANLR